MRKTGDYYFVSDVHLGLKVGDSIARERHFIAFLEGLEEGTKGLFLLGDIFDFWYEYKHVIPRGYTRVLGALAGVVDRGVPVHFFPGNHDLWTFGYLEHEVGMQVHRDPLHICLDGKNFLLGHGHRMGTYPWKSRMLHNMFHSRFLQKTFSMLHPRLAFALAEKWSLCNRKNGSAYAFKGVEEPTYLYAASYDKPIDYCITGHLHTSVRLALPDGGEWIVLEDWLSTGSGPGAVRGDVGIFGGTEQGKVQVVKAAVVVHQD
ncbi:MAG: UDP-2,3-diacylglucosamine diphosphatase [Bacteroidales bacterium]|jgi:UDP-2,3-diacylglucosamine hydrolase|nr:UDP-2,3-diacylglucosamine diphosphatase [Bacteroidales bacterium]HHV40606.1 UDP-2,3-diacylglucosamine diphosphatase [Bacteroidales bacterium]